MLQLSGAVAVPEEEVDALALSCVIEHHGGSYAEGDETYVLSEEEHGGPPDLCDDSPRTILLGLRQSKNHTAWTYRR